MAKSKGRPPATPEQRAVRFWSRVSRSRPGECWPWTASTDKDGYGQFWDGAHNVRAHAFAWRLSRGKAPASLPCVLHHCDNPPCCNPAHLFLGTNFDNMADKCSKGRQSRRGARGEQHRAAILTERRVLEIRAALERGELHRTIAARYGVAKGTITAIKGRRSWAWLN